MAGIMAQEFWDQKTQDSCVAAVVELIPDICPDYVKLRGMLFDFNPNDLMSYVMDEEDNGRPYPKNPALRTLKRKHDETEETKKPLEGFRKYANAPQKKRSGSEKTILTKLIMGDFPFTTNKVARSILEKNKWRLFPSFLEVQKISWQLNLTQQGTSKTGAKRRPGNAATHNNFQAFGNNATRERSAIKKDILEEHDAARELAIWSERFERPQFAAKQIEQQEAAIAKARGDLIECQCCFDEFVEKKLVCCQGETPHRFCINCMRQYAETLVGSSTYEMSCVSTVDKCSAGFSRQEKNKFLDKKLQQALDRIEAEAVLRLAGLESLETCPFCPYAAEYPPVAENKEFRCENPECAIISCRLCRKTTHLPKRCEEAVEDMVTGARKAIEEAMTDALVRKCNKCQTPFVKEAGCNKMHCMQRGCGHSQCYLCGKSMEKNDYSHFDSRNPKGCKVWDNSEERHQKDVKNAEKAARKKLAAENPGLDHEQLKIKHSEKVTQDLAKARLRWGNKNLGAAQHQRQELREDRQAMFNRIQREEQAFRARREQLDHQIQQAGMQQARAQVAQPPQAPVPQVQPALYAPMVAVQGVGVGAAPEARYSNHPLLAQVAGGQAAQGYLKKAEAPEAGVAKFRVFGTMHGLNERLQRRYRNMQLLKQHYQRAQQQRQAQQQPQAQQRPQAQQQPRAQQQPQVQPPRVVQPNAAQVKAQAFRIPDHAQVHNWLRDMGAATRVAPNPAAGPAPIQQFQGQPGHPGQNNARNLRPLAHRTVRTQLANIPAMVQQAVPMLQQATPMQHHAYLDLQAPVRVNDGTGNLAATRELQFGIRYGNLASLDNVARGRAIQRPLE